MIDHARFRKNIKQLYAIVKELEDMFPGRHFTPDGHMVGSIGECLVADACDGVKTLAFLIPNILPKAEDDLHKFLVSIDRVESLTGLDFMTVLEDGAESDVEDDVGVSVGEWQELKLYYTLYNIVFPRSSLQIKMKRNCYANKKIL